MKRVVRRYALVALLFVCFMAAGLLMYGQQANTNSGESVPPSKVIVVQASVIDQGVQLEWLEAQAGTHPITSYEIQRKRGKGNFEHVATLESIFLDYLDADGRTGDVYRIVAMDSQRPAGQSPASDHLVAAPEKPADRVAISPSSHVLGDSTTLEQSSTPNAKANTLRGLINQTFTDFDAALASDNTDLARNSLSVLQDYQRQALSLWPQLSADRKASLAQVCADQLDTFETNLHILPESDQFEGTLVVAGCDALQKGAE